MDDQLEQFVKQQAKAAEEKAAETEAAPAEEKAE